MEPTIGVGESRALRKLRGGGSPSVLLAGCSCYIRDAGSALCSGGLEVLSVSSPERAIMAIRTRVFDVVVVDSVLGRPPTFLLTPDGVFDKSIEVADSAMKSGAKVLVVGNHHTLPVNPDVFPYGVGYVVWTTDSVADAVRDILRKGARP
ncbi:MAG: hypothetical protein PHP62_04645 [Candidatus Moranbacteria bacterium]|nr:hypothetical protein [Candidatus Moranbacteria bacterium]